MRMTPRTSNPTLGQPSISQDQALPILRERLQAFEDFANRPFAEVQNNEAERYPTTESLVIRTFGQNSNQHNNYTRTRSAGGSSISRISFGHGPSAAEVAAGKQRRFEARTQATRASLRAMIGELEILSPKTESKAVYDSGDPFAFYSDLIQLLRIAKTSVLIVDAYFGRQIFDLYLADVPSAVQIDILTSIHSPELSKALPVAKLFQTSRSNFAMRTSNVLHDRVIIIDGRCWVIGQSIKDAAHKKPTYMVEMTAPEMLSLYSELWATSTVVAF